VESSPDRGGRKGERKSGLQSSTGRRSEGKKSAGMERHAEGEKEKQGNTLGGRPARGGKKKKIVYPGEKEPASLAAGTRKEKKVGLHGPVRRIFGDTAYATSPIEGKKRRGAWVIQTFTTAEVGWGERG